MMIAWRQFDSINSDFRQAGWGYSTDAGVTWTFPGVLQNNIFRSDPVTKSDEAGNFFYLSLQSTQQQSFFCDDLWRSTNGGQSWTEQSPSGAGHGGDKQWFTIDTNVGGMGHGFVYQFWTGFFACDFGEFNRSTDSGATWMSPINIPNSPDTDSMATQSILTSGISLAHLRSHRMDVSMSFGWIRATLRTTLICSCFIPTAPMVA